MSFGYHPLVKQLLDGELSLAELPPERRAEGAEALRLVGAVDRTPVVLSPALDDRVMAVVRRHAASRTRRAWHWVTAPRDVELRLRLASLSCCCGPRPSRLSLHHWCAAGPATPCSCDSSCTLRALGTSPWRARSISGI